MSERPVQLLLDEIVESIVKIERYTVDMTKEAFLADEKTSDAVAKNFEVIGEAASRLPLSFRSEHPSIEWVKVIGLRHRIVHDYFGVDFELLWAIIESDLSHLKHSIQLLRSGE